MTVCMFIYIFFSVFVMHTYYPLPILYTRCDYSTDSIDRGVTEDFVCSTPRNGRYVYITLMTTEVLTLCEVVVYASGRLFVLIYRLQCENYHCFRVVNDDCLTS